MGARSINLASAIASCLVACACHADGQCTQEALAAGKLPPALAPLAPQIDAGTVTNDHLCETWESSALNVDAAALRQQSGTAPIRGEPWTILFQPGVLSCTASTNCTAPVIGGVRILVGSAEGRVNTANVTLSPNRIAPLIADDRVRYIAPNCSALSLPEAKVVEFDATAAIKGGALNSERGCERTGTDQWSLSDACIPASLSDGKPSKLTAVLDTGIDCAHPAIRERIDDGSQPQKPRRCTAQAGTNYVYPGLPPDNCTGSERFVCDSHGTGVAGIIASTADEALGVDPRANLLSMRVLHADHHLLFVEPWTTVARAILDSAEAAQIINISANWYINYPWLAAAIDEATAHAGRDRLVVSAARGSPGRTAYPAAFTKCNEAVIGVSDILKTTNKPWLYEWGGKADSDDAYMVAPGVNVRTSYSDGTDAGAGYYLESGASFAAPHVSGAASLVWGTKEYSTCTAAGVREILECSARITPIGELQKPRLRLHLGCLFSQRDSPMCRGAMRCIESVKKQHCR